MLVQHCAAAALGLESGPHPLSRAPLSAHHSRRPTWHVRLLAPALLLGPGSDRFGRRARRAASTAQTALRRDTVRERRVRDELGAHEVPST
eukprot:7382325-Prymnesium_polylepis.1